MAAGESAWGGEEDRASCVVRMGVRMRALTSSVATCRERKRLWLQRSWHERHCCPLPVALGLPWGKHDFHRKSTSYEEGTGWGKTRLASRECSPFHSWSLMVGDFGQVGKKKWQPVIKRMRILKYIARRSENLLVRIGAYWTENKWTRKDLNSGKSK